MVAVVVDQLRADLLTRYDSLFTGGLRRLLDGGLHFPAGRHDHAGTSTGPGHATIATGVHPSRHGIVGNTWYEPDTVPPAAGGPEARPTAWRSVYSVEDTAAPLPGAPEAEGRSPANLLRPGLADWIVERWPGARVVSVSGKDRSAVTMAGRAPGHVYWFLDGPGRFTTSTHYRKELPGWLERFNRDRLPELLGDTVWESSVPERWRGLTRRDTVPYEGDGEHTWFPHRYALEAAPPGGAAPDPAAFHRWVARTPALDRATVELAVEAVRELGLGAGPGVDYLSVALSQVDRVGHDYGPLGREQLDNLLRLDRSLGRLLEALDREVGPDRYRLVLTADHGVLTIPEYRAEQGLDGRRLRPEERRAFLSAVRDAVGGAGAGASPATGDGPVLERAREVADRFDYVADVLPADGGPGAAPGPEGEPADSFAVLFRRSYHAERRTGPLRDFGLAVRWGEGVRSSWAGGTGTTHGSPYWYDRNVPILFYGPGIEPGTSDRPARTVDVAPTLARLVGLEPPDDLDGEPLVP